MEWDELRMGILQHEGGMVTMKAVEKAAGELSDAAKREPWKRTVLGLLADAVEIHGWEGVAKAEGVIDDIKAGKAPRMEFASLEVQSDVLATLQNAEADAQTAAKNFFVQIGKVLGVIIKAIIKAIL